MAEPPISGHAQPPAFCTAAYTSAINDFHANAISMSSAKDRPMSVIEWCSISLGPYIPMSALPFGFVVACTMELLKQWSVNGRLYAHVWWHAAPPTPGGGTRELERAEGARFLARTRFILARKISENCVLARREFATLRVITMRIFGL